MNIRASTDGAAVIDTNTKWMKIDEHTPLGVKLQLIRKADGVAHYGLCHVNETHYTHWCPLPSFDKDEP